MVNKTENVWLVYSAYTHELLKETSDLKAFCSEPQFAKRFNLGKNAYIQLYRTNHSVEDRRRLTYKGLFIRLKGIPLEEQAPFPALKYAKPTHYDLYTLDSNNTPVLLEHIPATELTTKLKALGFPNVAIERHLPQTFKLGKDGAPKLNDYRGNYLRPFGEGCLSIPHPKELLHELSGRFGCGNDYAIFNFDMEIIAIAKSLKGWAREMGVAYGLSEDSSSNLYATDTAMLPGSPIPKLSFYRGYFIRVVDALYKGDYLDFPIPSNGSEPGSAVTDNDKYLPWLDWISNPRYSNLDLFVWNEEASRSSVKTAHIIRSHVKSFECSMVDKSALYKIAIDNHKNGFVLRDQFNAVFLDDIATDKQKYLDIFLENDVSLIGNANRVLIDMKSC